MKKKDKYTVDFFINKFERTAPDEWVTGCLYNFNRTKFCARGHCVKIKRDGLGQEVALHNLFKANGLVVASVNDNLFAVYTYLGATPRDRILTVLYNIKNKKKHK